MFVPYILVINKKGYAKETKFKKELNSLPVVGEPIIDLYSKSYPFFNFSSLRDKDNNGVLMLDGKLTSVSQDTVNSRVDSLLTNFVQLVDNVESDSLHKAKKEYSNQDAIRIALADKRGLEIERTESRFTLDKYQALHNDLHMFAMILDNPESQFVRNLLYGVNTLLASDKIIPASSDSLFCYSINEETDEYFLNDKRAQVLINGLVDNTYYKPKVENLVQSERRTFSM